MAKASGERAQWGNSVQFTLTCIGFAVGLGNIWRFPSLAYQNGGGAFLVPYVICSIIFGLPVLYLELCIGQLIQKGPSKAFGEFAPAFQGIGWSMTVISAYTAIYYNVIVAWVLIYLFFVITGKTWYFSSCQHWWNKVEGQFCVSSTEDETCRRLGDGLAYFFNGTCHPSWMRDIVANKTELQARTMGATEQFFENLVLQRSNGIDDFGLFNWRLLIALVVVWIVTAICVMYGVKWIGKISYVTSTLPYFIIIALFLRAVTLPGAKIGIDFYLTQPKWEYVFKIATWKNALTQICFSLAIGFGGLLSLASHNEKSHNCFKDAIIVCVSDSLMSVIGGTAVFSILGFMAKHQGKELSEVVQEGTGLAFIAYPEAMGQLPAAWLWSFAFFVMLFLLGISSQFGLCEGVATSLIDQFPRLEAQRQLTVIVVCLFNCIVGVLMCTGSGIYWFTLFNNYTASFALCVTIFLEITCITTLYGIKRWREDLRGMFGVPRRLVGKWLGPSGYIVCINWMFISPLLILAVSIAIIKSMVVEADTYGKGAFIHIFPYWSRIIGWIIGISPSLMIPLFFCANYTKNRREKLPFAKMFYVQKTHPSYERIESRRQNRRKSHYQKRTKTPISSVFRRETAKVYPLKVAESISVEV